MPSFKGAGTGFSTQTNPDTLRPTYPATVDPGDLALLLIFNRNSTTLVPGPGGDWVSQASWDAGNRKSWLYARITDGTEDGATVTTGSMASTDARGARIYTLSSAQNTLDGTTANQSGLSTSVLGPAALTTALPNSLAVGFAHISVGTVTTSDWTGETGGNWTEAVAEYISTTPGLIMQLQTAQMVTPGTISGGSFTIGVSANWQTGAVGIVASAGGAGAPSGDPATEWWLY